MVFQDIVIREIKKELGKKVRTGVCGEGS